MDILEGYVEHIIFRNEGNGYTVFVLSTKEDEVTCVGMLPPVDEGQALSLKGSYQMHTSYGEQFSIQECSFLDPQSEIAIERYLGSGAIKGIGSALAARIVRRFKEDTFRIIEEEPERLAEVKGISERKAREIADQVMEKKDVRSAFLFLTGYGISGNLAVKLYQQYGTEIYRVIRENPYRLADEVTGVGFKIADEIARKAGIEVDSDFRIRSGIFYTLTQATGEGHVYLPEGELHQRTQQLLQLKIEDLSPYLTDLAIERKVIVRKEETKRQTVSPDRVEESGEIQQQTLTKVYASSLYYLELNTAKMLCDLDAAGRIDEEKTVRKIHKIEKRKEFVLDDLQRRAVLEAIRRGILILTGGPGTGKTTTINTMIEYFESEGMEIAPAAPTGRAAKRMTEATGCEAKTIHRLLEVEGAPEGGGGTFARNASQPLEYDVIIIDEMSMVDIFLMHALVSAVTPGTRLILVGDASQLPSVGPGCVLRDMIDSQAFHVVRLKTIFRQAQESDIVVNAHKIDRGEHMALDNKSRDFFFLKRNDANVIISIIIQLISQKLPGYVHASWQEIQVLSPVRKGLLGVERLNRILQQYLNPADPSKGEYMHGDTLFREGDKVMQIKNNYQLVWEIRGRHGFVAERGSGIFNGDIGTVASVDPAAEILTVCFDEGRFVDYPLSGLDELELAYAVTIHKSQGSEYPAVVIPLLPGPRMLMNRNLLYTAVTRAKSCVTIVGDPAVFYQMIDNTQQQERYTSLAMRIRELVVGS